MSDEPFKLCPYCGAPNPNAARYCEQCGEQLPSAAPTEAPEDATRPPDRPPAPQATTAGPPPWLTGTTPPSAAEMHQDQAPAKKRGCASVVLGCLALIIILALSGALLLLYVVRPYAQNRTRDELNRVAATVVVQLGPVSVPSGRLTVTDNEINQQLQAHESEISPLSAPVVSISPAGMQVTFKLAGTESTFSGGLTAANGRLAIVNPTIAGPAGQLVRPSDLARIVEDQLGSLLSSSHLIATAVQLNPGSLTILTEPA